MMRLHYAGGSVLLDDQVCDAVLRFAQALADTQTSDIIAVPTLTEGGTVADARMLIGPASQLFSTPVEGATDMPPSAHLVEELDRRARRLKPSKPRMDDTAHDFVAVDPDLM